MEDGQELYCKFRRANLVEGKVGEEGRERWKHTFGQGWINGVHVGSGEGAIPHTGCDRSANHLKYLTFRGSKNCHHHTKLSESFYSLWFVQVPIPRQGAWATMELAMPWPLLRRLT